VSDIGHLLALSAEAVLLGSGQKGAMKKKDVIRAWRDGEYYSSLSNEERAALPDSPALVVDLGDDVLASISGGCSYVPCSTSAMCTPCPPKWCS
jgi:mersacidin/lichenicidin family type 2 lantibiotic